MAVAITGSTVDRVRTSKTTGLGRAETTGLGSTENTGLESAESGTGMVHTICGGTRSVATRAWNT